MLTSTLLSLSMGLPSCSQLTSWTGWPETMHWNWASLSTSTVCTCGCRCAVKGAVFVKEIAGQSGRHRFEYLLFFFFIFFGCYRTSRIGRIWETHSHTHLSPLATLGWSPRPPYCSPSTNIFHYPRDVPEMDEINWQSVPNRFFFFWLSSTSKKKIYFSRTNMKKKS